MTLFQNYKPAIDNLYNESMRHLMEEENFYKNMTIKFEALEKEVSGLSEVKTREILSKSIINRILKVHNRIILVRDLVAKIYYADNDIQVYMYPGLVTYLYLTCFDQLGTPIKGWRFFPEWVNSNSCSDEVHEAVDSTIDNFGSTDLGKIKAGVKNIYNYYHAIYGVKKTFFRFLREILPAQKRNILLNSIFIEKLVDETEKLAFLIEDVYKENWLFETRNNYTHNLFTTQTNVTTVGKSFDGKEWLLREEILTKEGVTVIWVQDNFDSILEDCVLSGIKFLIEKQ